MLICAEIDAILLTSGVRKFMTSPTPEQEPDSFNWQLVTPLPDKPDLTVRNSVIKGRAIWTDYRMSYASVFVSDAMRDLYAKAGMSGWDERNYWREE